MASYIYDVPFLKTSSKPVLKYVVAGWQVGGVTHDSERHARQRHDQRRPRQHRDLRPAAPGSGRRGADAQLLRPESRRRCELINCFDASAFALPAQFTFGNAPRNVLRGPKFAVTDLSLMKNIPLGGHAQFQIRAEIFNVFNTVNYGNPNGDVRLGDVRPHQLRAQNMRQVQLGGKLIF